MGDRNVPTTEPPELAQEAANPGVQAPPTGWQRTFAALRHRNYRLWGSEIRRLIYTTNSIEGYNRQLRKVTKTKGAFPTDEAARKLLFLVNRDITRKWTAPVANWARIRNQLAIRFAGRLPV